MILVDHHHDWIHFPWQLWVNLEDKLACFCIATVGFFHSFTVTSQNKRITEKIFLKLKQKFSLICFISSLNSASPDFQNFIKMIRLLSIFTMGYLLFKVLWYWSIHENNRARLCLHFSSSSYSFSLKILACFKEPFFSLTNWEEYTLPSVAGSNSGILSKPKRFNYLTGRGHWMHEPLQGHVFCKRG